MPVATEKLRKGEKIVKKVKRDEPARIIKLPVAPVERTAEPARVRPKLVEPRGPKVVAVPVEIGPPAPGADDRDEKKRKKKWGTDEEAGKKFIKKKISFRTKAVVEAEDLYDEASRSRKPRKGGKAQPEVATHKSQVTVAKAIKRRIKMDEAIVLSELAKRMGVKAGEIIKVLMGMGVMATVNQSIDFDTVVLIAAEFNYEAERASIRRTTCLNRSMTNWRRSSPGRRSSPSWGMSTTARPRCSMSSAKRASPKPRPAGSPSTSAPTT